MCGIAGIISPFSTLVQPQKVQIMMDTLHHRGPDGEGKWTNDDNTVCLGHKRLAILDTSNAAAQPFNYLHYTLVFNGEIYNYVELKNLLQKQGYTFRTNSDSEVIPAAYDFWGKDCLHQFDGMFAFALYDSDAKELWIARDRFGEKPLYYHTNYQQRGMFEQFLFASEMKALWAIGVPKELNGTMVLNYLSLGYTQNPIKQTQTFYSNILSLPPGHYLSIQPDKGKVQMKRWYSLSTSIQKLKEKRLPTEDGKTIEEFQELFTASIKRRLRSDVSLGTSLSGGLDSSSIVAVLMGNNLKSLNTFSAVFPGFKHDERAYIKEVQQYFSYQNFDSNFITPTAEDYVRHWESLMFHQEEPVQSASVFTQFMVYKLAKEKGVTVLLDGQGADEILGGYKKYTPWFLQEKLTVSYSDFKKEKSLLQANGFLDQWNLKNYAAAFMPEKTASQLQLKAVFEQKNLPFIEKEFYEKYQNKDTLQKPVVKKMEDLLYYNTTTVGLQELLRYADRNSMAQSREVRLPFLNHDLVEFIFSLPSSFKIRDGFTKWILRKSVENKLPDTINWRKGKVGYEPPQEEWMKNASIIELIHVSRKKLVDKNILSPKILNTATQTSSAHSKNNHDWRYLSVAAIL